MGCNGCAGMLGWFASHGYTRAASINEAKAIEMRRVSCRAYPVAVHDAQRVAVAAGDTRRRLAETEVQSIVGRESQTKTNHTGYSVKRQKKIFHLLRFPRRCTSRSLRLQRGSSARQTQASRMALRPAFDWNGRQLPPDAVCLPNVMCSSTQRL